MVSLFNVDHQPAVIDANQRAVMPGDSHEFTEEQIKAGVTGLWSRTDPRRGRSRDRAFNSTRGNIDPAPPETKE